MPTNNKKKKSKGNKNTGNSNNRGHSNSTGNSAPAGGGYYEIYKLATANFWEWVNKTTVSDNPVRTIGDLQQGAAAIHDAVLRAVNNEGSGGDAILHKMIPPVQVMRNLTTSIKYRKMVMDEKFGGGDDGHRFMLQALCYCRSVLRGARRVGRQWIIRQQQRHEQSSTNGDTGVEDATFLGRFQALALDDDDDDDDDGQQEESEAEGHDEPVTPVTEASANNRDIQEALIDGDLCFQAAMLLVTMNGLMEFIDQQYAAVKQALRDMNQDQEEQKSHVKIIRLIMQASSVVNMATQTIRAAENALMACYPHISSFYHILALLFCADFVNQVHAMMPSKSQQNQNLALDFVADMVFEYFGVFEETEVKTKRFAKKNKVPLDSLKQLVEKVEVWVWMEIVFEGHEWLARFQYIGGDRCILNTLQLVQKLTANPNPNLSPEVLVQKLTAVVPNLSTEVWNNEPTRLRIRDDLDCVFTTTVFPKLWRTCSSAPFHDLVVEDELLTVLNMIHLHAHAKSCFGSSVTSPVSVATTFAVHAVLTAMFVVQGDGDLKRVAIITKLAFDNFFAQLEVLETRNGNHPNFYDNLKVLKSVIPFTHTFPKPDPQGDLSAFWNPCVAGGYLLYVTYHTSLDLGMITYQMGQLKITLHLYHALKKTMDSFRVPFLEEVDNIFKSAKAVWPAGQPERGSFAKHFALALDGKSPLPHPREYSASYRTIVLQSFEDKRSDRDGKLMQDFFDVFFRAAMIHESVQADGHVMLSMNYVSLGSLLLEFVNKFSETMGWEEEIQNATSAMSSPRFSEMELRKTSLELFFGDMLRDLDGTQRLRQTLVIRDSRPVLVQQKEAEPIVFTKICQVMVKFFENVPPQQYRFYT